MKIRSRENPVRKRSIFKGFLDSDYPQHTALYWVLSLRDSRLYQDVPRVRRFRNLESNPDSPRSKAHPMPTKKSK